MIKVKDLEELLYISGVNNNNIEKMKYTILHEKSGCLDVFFKEKNFYQEKIPVNKITGICTSWDVKGKSVYDCFMSIADDSLNPPILNYNRIAENVDNLIREGIKAQFKFYESDDESNLRAGLPIIEYYHCSTLNKEFYFSDATHRTISAMMFGAPALMGKVREYELDTKKVENHRKIEKKLAEFESEVDKLKNLSLYNFDKLKSDLNDLSLYNFHNRSYEYFISYKNLKLLKGKLEIPDLNNINGIERFKKDIDKKIKLLREIDAKLSKKLFLKLFIRIIRSNKIWGRSIKKKSSYKDWGFIINMDILNEKTIYTRIPRKIIYEIIEQNVFQD